MEAATLGLIIVIFTAVLPCTIIGYLIAFKQYRNLISGWSDSKVSDPQACARIIGISLILMSILLAVTSYLWWSKIISDTEITFYLIPSVLLPLVAAVYSKIKYGIK